VAPGTVTDDLLDGLPPAALTMVRHAAEELAVRESMIFLAGREFTGEPPGYAPPSEAVNARLPDRCPRRTLGHHPGELDQLTQPAAKAPRQRRWPL
jgi:hypothetical protein